LCLTITEAEIEEGMQILGQAMKSVWVKGEEVEGTDGQQEMR
jgi:acetylornithine aminotransferase